MMDAEKINRTIHEWLGKCWHDIQEFIEGYKTGRKCIRCNKSFTLISWKSPDYTTDLNAVRGAELAVIEKFGTVHYAEALADRYSNPLPNIILAVTAPALTRAQAVCDVLEGK